MDGLPVLDLWDMVIEVSRSTNNTVQPNHNGIKETCVRPNPKTKTPTDKRREKVDQLSDADHVPPTHVLPKASLSRTFLKTMKLSSK